MSQQSKSAPSTALGRAVNAVEETVIAVILGLMTIITFANVVVRYAFNSNILWALETTTYLFAWLVLLGASYAVKTSAHLGVDVLVKALPPGPRKALGLVCAAVCIVFALLLLKGGWDFWAPFAELQPTTGRWFPTGFDDVRGRGWFETDDVPMPAWLNPYFAEWFNVGEPYEKIPRLIPYVIMPVAALLLSVRFILAGIDVWNGTRETLVASHEVEDALEDVAARRAAQEEAV
ncbi:MAG: TRAP transporter small permease [Pseudomonadota bacterium]